MGVRSGLENRDYGRRDPSLLPRDTLYPQKLALTSPTYGGHFDGIVHLRTKATELLLLLWVSGVIQHYIVCLCVPLYIANSSFIFTVHSMKYDINRIMLFIFNSEFYVCCLLNSFKLSSALCCNAIS
jgi:hypothetical protein